MAIDLSGVIPGLQAVYEAIGEEVTFTRPSNSDSDPTAGASWTTFAAFKWNASVFSKGSWHKAPVIYVAAHDESYVPMEGDKLTAASAPGRDWKVNAVEPHATGLAPFGWAVELSS